MINLLGGNLLAFNLFLLFCWLFYFKQYLNFVYTRLVYSVFCLIFLLLQTISLAITNQFVGYEFIIHFNYYNIKSMSSLFYDYLFNLLLVFFLLSLAFFYNWENITNYFHNRIMRKYFGTLNLKFKRILFFILIMFSTYIFNLEGKYKNKGFLKQTIETYHYLSFNGENDFLSSLENCGFENYTSIEDIEAHGADKDIVIITLESFEKAFLGKRFDNVTPKLQELSNEWTYVPIKPTIGSNWTSGSLYSMFTGIPAFFGRPHNRIFNTSLYKKITSLPDVLKFLDYDLIHISKDANFASTRKMLECFHFDKIIDKNEVDEGELYDRNIFEKLKLEISNNKKNGTKFAIIASTLDTHGPDGIYDEFFKKKFSKLNGLEYSAAVVDFLIKDFIFFMKSQNFLNSTTIIIIPDHLYMSRPKIFTKSTIRELFFLTNAALKVEEKEIKRMTQLDIPLLILKSSGIKHNVQFFTENFNFINDKIIKNNRKKIISLNNSGYLLSDIVINRRKTNNINKSDIKNIIDEICIAHAGGEIDGYIYTNSLEALDYNYKNGFKMFELDIQETKDKKIIALHHWKEWNLLMKNNKESEPSNYLQFISKKLHARFTPLDMDRINKWFKEHPDAILITDKINKPKFFADQFNFPDRLIMELFTIESINEAKKEKIKYLITDNLFYEMIKNKNARKLKNENIAINFFNFNKYIDKQASLMKKISKNNCKFYIFGFNSYFGEDPSDRNTIFREEEVLENNYSGINFLIYADKLPYSN